MRRIAEPLPSSVASPGALAGSIAHRPGAAWSGVALAAFGAIAFSGKAVIVKLGYRYGADAITLIALRMGIAFPFFAIVAVIVARRPGVAPLTTKDRWKVVVLGFLGYYLASYLDFLGLAYVSASLERLILYLNPTLVLFIGMVCFDRRVNGRQVVALVIGYVGVGLAFAHDLRIGGSDIALGSFFVFASALAYAIYLVGSGELLKRVGTLRLTAYASCVAALCCLLQFALTRPLTMLLDLPAPVWALSLVNGTLCTVVPVFAVMMAVDRLGASATSQIGMVGPVSTIILADLLLDERMGSLQILGTVLVMVGVFIVSHGKVAPSRVAT